MKRYLKIDEQLYLVAFEMKDGSHLISESWNYNPLDSFLLDYDNLAIKSISAEDFSGDYVCLLTSKLIGDEEKTILKTDHFLRPTNKEPFIRGLYATVFRNGKNSLGKKAINVLEDVYLNSLEADRLLDHAKMCTFSSKGRLLQGRDKIN